MNVTFYLKLQISWKTAEFSQEAVDEWWLRRFSSLKSADSLPETRRTDSLGSREVEAAFKSAARFNCKRIRTTPRLQVIRDKSLE